VFIADQAVILPPTQGGQLRVLGVTTRERSPQLPEIPTVAEAGNLPGYELFAWFVLAAPTGTPAAHLARLNVAVRHASANPELRQRLEQVLGMTVTPSTPEEAAAFMRSETVKWTNAIRAAGIEPE